ncbi:MAG: immune inhibitor A [Anaerolineales bacterium]|nr:immune inhibitor A [Anaerolineales bacterium]
MAIIYRLGKLFLITLSILMGLLSACSTSSPVTTTPAPTVSPAAINSIREAILRSAEIPFAEPLDLARRLSGLRGDVPTNPPPASPLPVGAKQSFWVISYSHNKVLPVKATLHYVSDHAYYWLEDTTKFNSEDIETLASVFEEQIYPTTRSFFGSEPMPGIDGDPHIYVLFVRNIGSRIDAYFSPWDLYSPIVYEFSNAHEMFVLNIDKLGITGDYTYYTLAHEYQHLIHAAADPNEEVWINEGCSGLAQFLLGDLISTQDGAYANYPDHQLNNFGDGADAADYGAPFLFMTYFLDRFGQEAVQALAAHPANGLESVDQVLQEFDLRDPERGKIFTADDIVLDWAIANLAGDEQLGDGRYFYHNYPEAPRAGATEAVQDCESGPIELDVRQYGVDLVRIRCSGPHVLRFAGSTETPLLPVDARSGRYYYWSNRGERSDMTLTRTFDFTDSAGPLTLSFWTWYDLETDNDYVFLLASGDGESWEFLETPSGTGDNPNGNNYGWGITGRSPKGQWVQERVDLSRFVGQQVQIRFEYVTNDFNTGEGMVIDDIAVPEIDYFSDLEANDGGWKGAGFVRVENTLPQTFRLALVTQRNQRNQPLAKREAVGVEIIPIGINNTVEIPFNTPEEDILLTLVVVGTTRYTRQPAIYTLEFLE